MKKIKLFFSSLSPAQVLALGFMLIIFAGSLLLRLPISAEPGVSINYLQALFTATSAVCVTGLTVVDTATSFSLFGELVIIGLIQLGGLGFMLFATFVLVLAKRRISLKNRILLHETMSMPGFSGTVRTSLRFIMIVFAIEAVGAVILAAQFIPKLGWGQGIYFGVFHSISAFCNAGFDLFGAAGSLTQFGRSPGILYTIGALIVFGGLGFAVIADVVHRRGHFKELHLHSKVAVMMTLSLLALGCVYIALMEWDNPLTLAREGANALDKINNAMFQSITTRTAGYFSFVQGEMRDAGKIGSIILMFIGASPASTGGGIKTTTFFVVLVLLRSVFYGNSDVNAFHKRLPLVIIRTALAIFLINLGLLVVGSVLMSLAEEGKGFGLLDNMFEQASALATVGLTSAGTANYSVFSKIWLILLMYFGRVGPLTMMLSFQRRSAGHTQGVRYAEDNLYVG